ncbi:MAG: ASCH domain-containing protein [Deltaproteobacteria bacterium]|nr:ASCH domain-containing protein [Deltaproteobacteria bacterium]
MKVLLISIRPEFAGKVLSGEKTVEFRRVRPNVQPGDVCVIYASGKTRALVGAFEIGGILDSSAAGMWRRWGEVSGTTRAAFMAYFDGASRAYGLEVRDPFTFASPMPLSDIRRVWTEFRPPQSYCYVRSDHDGHRALLDKIRQTPEFPWRQSPQISLKPPAAISESRASRVEGIFLTDTTHTDP